MIVLLLSLQHTYTMNTSINTDDNSNDDTTVPATYEHYEHIYYWL